MSNLLKSRLRQNMWAFPLIWKRKEQPDLGRRVLRKGDDLVIEGYPRSGNTFATQAFRMAQDREMNIGNHFHAVAQIKLAQKYGIPAMVVFREPYDAILSLVVFHQGRMSASVAAQDYIAFHRPLLSCLSAFSPAPFKEVISNFKRSTDRLNRQFQTNFRPYSNSPDADQHVRDAIESKRQSRIKTMNDQEASDARKTTPSEHKAQLRATYAAQMHTVSMKKALHEAQALYAAILEHPQLIEESAHV